MLLRSWNSTGRSGSFSVACYSWQRLDRGAEGQLQVLMLAARCLCPPGAQVLRCIPLFRHPGRAAGRPAGRGTCAKRCSVRRRCCNRPCRSWCMCGGSGGSSRGCVRSGTWGIRRQRDASRPARHWRRPCGCTGRRALRAPGAGPGGCVQHASRLRQHRSAAAVFGSSARRAAARGCGGAV